MLQQDKLKSAPSVTTFMPFLHQPEPMPGLPAATITTPSNNTSVESSVPVEGTAQNITGEEYYLWLIVFDYRANRHYPQRGPVAVSADGHWRMTAFLNDSGRYDIVALAADKNANEILSLYQAASESSQQYLGLPAVPAGCVTLVSVTVSRT